MWKITSGSQRIISIVKGNNQIDGFIILPGVTNFSSIHIQDSRLIFTQMELNDTITVHFKSPADLERFLIVFDRDSKIDAVLNSKNNER